MLDYHDTRWFKDARVYHIVIDRFNGDNILRHDDPDFCGGTLLGINEKLGYIRSLGFTCIWISPFYKTTAYHGYHITDYFSVDRHFGTMGDLETLVSTTHGLGMKIIVDMVPNHCSVLHPFFVDACKHRDSKYRKLFIFEKWPHEYKSFLGFAGELAKLNLDSPPASQYFISNALFWLSKGIDGFRVDHVVGISRGFLERLMDAVTGANPSAVIIGEAWGQGIQAKHFGTLDIKHKLLHRLAGISQEHLQKEYVGLLHGVLDFEARDIVMRHYIKGRDAGKTRRRLQEHFGHYPGDFLLPLFLDNHDTNRIMFECNNDKELVRDAFQLLGEFRQPLVIYYNTERLPTHDEDIHRGKPHADNSVRQVVNWDEEPTFNPLQ